MSKVKINPYNFMPLGHAPKREKLTPEFLQHRSTKKSYSGCLAVTLRAVSPVFLASRLPGDVIRNHCGCTRACTADNKLKTIYTRFSHRGGRPMIPATSLKGMVRSVFEAATDSCLGIFDGVYGRKIYPADEYANSRCSETDGYCSACRLFGTLSGEKPLGGRVRFTDAIGDVNDIEKGDWTLPPLQLPNPHRHVPFYAKDGVRPQSGPRGRKFYYHQNPQEVFNGTILRHTHLNSRIKEYLRRDGRLHFNIWFEGLQLDELVALLFALELDRRWDAEKGRYVRALGHKIGMGKPLGFGSVVLDIDDEETEVFSAANRYLELGAQKKIDIREDFEQARRALESKIPIELKRILYVNAWSKGKIAYPDQNWFQDNGAKPLPSDGIFDTEN